MPPLRLAIIDDVAQHPASSTQEVRRRIDKPRKTVDRQLQSLHMLDVLTCDEIEYGENERVRWYYTLAEYINPDALDPQKLARKIKTGGIGKREDDRQDENDGENDDDVTRPTYFSGQLFDPGDPSTNGHAEQADRDAANAAYRAGICRDRREQPPSAGRPRCNECHATYVRGMAGYDQ